MSCSESNLISAASRDNVVLLNAMFILLLVPGFLDSVFSLQSFSSLN